jgi:hypothetical protein
MAIIIRYFYLYSGKNIHNGGFLVSVGALTPDGVGRVGGGNASILVNAFSKCIHSVFSRDSCAAAAALFRI